MSGILLRSPPFPGVKPGVAAVSRAATGKRAPVDAARFDGLLALLRRARVGGAFWAQPAAAIAEGTIVVRASAGPTLDRARAAGRAIVTVAGEVDPWSLLAPGIRLVAPAGDEWRLIATIAGAEVIDADAAALRAELGAALFDPAYRDPFTGAAIEAEAAIAILADWRRQIDANRPIAAVTGIAWWKKQAIGRFLWADRAQTLVMTDEAAPAVAAAVAAGGTIATWPSRAPAGLGEAAAGAGIAVAAIEDGFIRSVGLGAALHPPQSIVIDRAGIYYDPAHASDLETILETAAFPAPLLARAARLREAIVAAGISKYASDPAAARAAPAARDRRTVLVTGQVEDDMSVRAAGGEVGGNLDLLRRARAAEPDARILFRPHPDVDAGHRVGKVADADLLGFADAIVRTESMAALLARVDAVHVLTSQTGFEAVLRGLETIVHGHPFYAGWGLTTDLAGPLARRTRRLTRDELVAGALILYPRYLDPETGLPCPPEILLDRFARQSRPRWSPLIAARRLQGRIARLLGRTTD